MVLMPSPAGADVTVAKARSRVRDAKRRMVLCLDFIVCPGAESMKRFEKQRQDSLHELSVPPTSGVCASYEVKA
jgi:hypothetical protein